MKDSVHPGISIVVPTFGRVDLLLKLLDSLKSAQEAYEGASEVILADASQDDVGKRVRDLAERFDARYISSYKGVSAQRNAGVRAVRFSWILFIDSDCIVQKGILEDYAQQLSMKRSAVNTVVLIGVIRFEKCTTLGWRAVTRTPVISSFDRAIRLDNPVWGVTANMMVQKIAFEKTGGFDESFVRPGGEDVDFCLRLRAKGFNLSTSRNAVVIHTSESWDTLGKNMRRYWAYGTADITLIEKLPDYIRLDLPTPVLHLTLVTAITGLYAFAIGGISFAAIFVWICVYLSIVLWRRMSADGFRLKMSTIAEFILGEFLMAVLDAGRICTGLLKGRLSILWERFAFDVDEESVGWSDIVLSQTAAWFAWIVIAIFLLLLT